MTSLRLTVVVLVYSAECAACTAPVETDSPSGSSERLLPCSSPEGATVACNDVGRTDFQAHFDSAACPMTSTQQASGRCRPSTVSLPVADARLCARTGL